MWGIPNTALLYFTKELLLYEYLTQSLLKKGQDLDIFATAIEALEIGYRNNFSENEKVTALVSAAGPQHEATILNKMESLESVKGEEVKCNALVENMSKLWRVSGSWRGIFEDPTETELVNPGYFAKDKACLYCKKKGHLKFECPKFTGKQSEKKCEYPGYTT